MRRRTVVAAAAVGALRMALHGRSGGHAAAAASGPQLYTVRDLMRADFEHARGGSKLG
jgi:hypothetical protein